MKNERLWERLVESLDSWTSAAETGPGQIEVALPNSGIPARRALILMTPDEWGAMAGVMWGDFDDAVQGVRRALLMLQPNERFAVYSEYRLEPSTEPTLPQPPDLTPEPGGEWVVHDRAGRITSRLADRSEPDERR